ncbi:uncharacterized protein [Choristoneura fumiferana]|uniref:uncharacterized protein n=1 Tax=Choristoneura fumiferana TaxID=7141 RepID=UPI003D15A65F
MGWTIQGPVTGVQGSMTNMTTTLHSLTNLDISDLWSLEAVGIRDPAEQTLKSTRDMEVIKAFEENVHINTEGRYEVCLPWRDVPRPQTNYDLAKKRLDSAMSRLKHLGKIDNYDKVFREWLQLNIIEVAPDQSIQGHYMAHHPVIKESSLTTKLRPVFDASAKDRNGISLNSCLEKGVNLLEKIPNLLINFRRSKIGVTADIAKAFLQISIVPEDRDYLRFLWWSTDDEGNRALVTYRHRRVVFGVTSSPFHLVATINHHLDNCTDNLKETAIKLKKSFYVDNCVTSLESEEELEKFIRESKDVMMNGVTCPTTIVPKMIIQKSWCRKLTWDEELPEELAKEFKKWRLTRAPIKECETSLHVFCDASKEAYSACIYLRSKLGEQVNLSLVLAKARVTPVKQITIPRLELIAATLASRLAVTAIESLAIANCSVYYWSDSSVVLTWIKGDGPWSVFVNNRVKEIKTMTSTTAWRHVPGHLNPADLPSRGVNPKGFLESRWWEGPSWLLLDEDSWPTTDFTVNSTAVEDERKKTGTVAMLIQEESILDRFTYFSSYIKIVRMICWMLRLKKKSVTRELTYDEFEYAENVLCYQAQRRLSGVLSNGVTSS